MQPPKDVLCDRYRLISLLGRGGMGSVWLGEHLSLGTQVAIKLLDPRLAGDEMLRARFLREARAAASLRSANVVHILDHGVDGDLPFIVMELLLGESLGARVRREGKLPPEDVASIFASVGRAMSRAHDAGIIHRDLKPDNIFLGRDEDGKPTVKVVDFGIAKIIDAEDNLGVQTSTGAMLGTPHYMSPEQARGRKDLDARADLWAISVIAFECLVGRRPFVGETTGDLVLQICSDPLPVPSSFAEVPAGFDAWFARGVNRTLSERFTSAQELVLALEDVLTPGRHAVLDHSEPSGGAVPDAVGTDPTLPVAETGTKPNEVNDPSEASTGRLVGTDRSSHRLVVAGVVLALAGTAILYGLSARRPSPVASTSSSSSSATSLSSNVPPLPPDDLASQSFRKEQEANGWMMSGSGKAHYTVRLDPNEPHHGRPSLAFLPVDDPKGTYGLWVRVVPGKPYVGKRVRVAAFMKTAGAKERVDFWARVQAESSPADGAGLGAALVNPPADSDWTKQELVLDIPDLASSIQFGFGIAGPGRWWIDDPTIEVVGDDVPLTGHEHDQRVGDWLLAGPGASSATLSADADTAHAVNQDPTYKQSIVVAQFAPTKMFEGRKAHASFEVRTKGFSGAPSCFIDVRNAQFAGDSSTTTSKTLPTSSDGFEQCDLTVDVGASAKWVVFGLRESGPGEAWLRRAKLEAK